MMRSYLILAYFLAMIHFPSLPSGAKKFFRLSLDGIKDWLTFGNVGLSDLLQWLKLLTELKN